MSLYENLGMAALRSLNAETAHKAALLALRYGFAPMAGKVTSPRLKTQIAGLHLDNPVGIAAGFDKNAQALGALSQSGFGFVEVGAATPRPQPGNPKPRLFRLSDDRAVINRFGFNNDGMEAIAARLAKRPDHGIVGLNLGANKDSPDRADDFARVLACCGPHLDFATVNVSSPNTENLRDLQGAAALRALLDGVIATRDGLPKTRRGSLPIFLKIAPDLNLTEIEDIAETALSAGIDGVIATNTTLARPDSLTSYHRVEPGGLSGAPLFEPSTRVLAQLSRALDSKLPIIGVGGISSAQDAYAKIRAGASAVQLYSALVYQGLSLGPKIARELGALLDRDGFTNVAQATGTGREEWL